MNENGYELDKRKIAIAIIILFIIPILSYILFFKDNLSSISKINNDNLTNKVLVIYDKKHPLKKEIEKNLKSISNDMNIDIYKINYNSDFSKFMGKQKSQYELLNPQIIAFEKKILTNQTDRTTLTKIQYIICNCILKVEKRKSIDKELIELESLTKLSKEELTQYINLRVQYKKVIFSGNIDTNSFPMVIVMKNEELGRFVVSYSDKETLQKKLINTKASLLIKTNTLQGVLRYNMKKKNFIVLYSDGYNLNLSKLDKYLTDFSNRENMEYFYIDVTNIGNSTYYKTYSNFSYTKPITTTPTIVTYINGMEFQRVNNVSNYNQVDTILNNFKKKT